MRLTTYLEIVMNFNIVRFILIAAMLFIYPVSAFSEHQNGNANQTFISQVRITPDQFIKNNSNPNICRLTFKKSIDDKFTLLKAEAHSGKTSHFLKIEHSDYTIEVWQNKELIFTGGFNNPNVVRHELMDANSTWEQKNIPLNEATFAFRVPLVNSHQPLTIKFYRMGTNL